VSLLLAQTQIRVGAVSELEPSALVLYMNTNASADIEDYRK
jgi:hypothetical protein